MEVINFAILIISLFGYCAFWVYIKLAEPSSAPLYTLVVIGVTASIGAMLGLLLPFTYALYAIGIVLLIVTLVLSAIKRTLKELIIKSIDPGLIIFLYYLLCSSGCAEVCCATHMMNSVTGQCTLAIY